MTLDDGEDPEVSTVWALLRHPLTVALIGVAITGVLVPYFARRWQDHQKALEVRVGLAAEMSESLMGLMATSTAVSRRQHAESAAERTSEEKGRKLQDELDRARESLTTERLKFEVRQVVIGTKLHAYLRDQTIGDRWRATADAVIKYVEVDEKLPDGFHSEKLGLTDAVLNAQTVFETSWLPKWLQKDGRRVPENPTHY